MILRKRSEVVMDIECYRNYFLVMFKSVQKGTIRAYELYDGQPLNIAEIKMIMAGSTVVTFNGNDYDLPMLQLALRGASNLQLKKASDEIIVGNLRGWQFERRYDMRRPAEWDHIDLIEVAPGQASLKLYGGRLHCERLQELPIDPAATITPAQRAELRLYCANDLQTTIDLYTHLLPQLELRKHMTVQYKTDLRSKSDAQIAEAVIKSKCAELMGAPPVRPGNLAGQSFSYEVPQFITFRRYSLLQLLDEIRQTIFVVGEDGSVQLPESLEGRAERIGHGVYRMGIGGLHSSEKSQAVAAGPDEELCEIDVTGYYPSIIIRCNLSPAHLKQNDAFPRVYKAIVDTRVKAKHTGDTTTANTLKIVVNGGFGKLGSKYSILYSPHLLIQVTLTGQLCLLMLIETLEHNGITVVSANTDGLAVRYPKRLRGVFEAIVKEWEQKTGFTMEETPYAAIYSRDVNNYIAVKKNGSIKGKGAFADASIAKNPNQQICITAVKEYLSKGTPIEDTIRQCRDIRQFVTVRTVRGGAVQITDSQYDNAATPGMMRDILLRNNWMVVTPGPLTPAIGKDGECREALFAHPLFTHSPVPVQAAYRLHCGEDTVRYVGKVVRYYVGIHAYGCLHYLTKNKMGNRNKVPDSDKAVPLMELPPTFPEDIAYHHYIQSAHDILNTLGVRKL